jgi:hypothetical protein
VHRAAVLLVGLTVGLPLLLLPGRTARGDIAGDIAALTAALPACDSARAHCIGIRLHVTVGEAPDGAADSPASRPANRPADKLIAHPAWFAVQLAAANRHFAPLDVAFQVVGIDTLPASAARIATREQRDAVADGRLTGKVIHVFITGQLDDIDQPGAIIRGVTWHLRGSDRKYVILSTVAPERVLAHEFGHVFGLPHSKYAISIMNKTERAEPPPEERTFADPEIAAMRPVLKRLLREQIIADVAH